MGSENGYVGRPHQNKWDKWESVFVEVLVVIATMGLFSFQVGCWVALGLVGWRILNIGKDLI